MNKKYVSIGLAAALLGLVVGTLSLTAGAAPNAVRIRSWQDNPFSSTPAVLPKSHQNGQTLVVTTTQVNNMSVDVAGDGQGPGDYFVFRAGVYNLNDVRVGRDNGQCTINFTANQDGSSINCEVAFHFNGAGGIRRGKIMVEGNLVFTPTSTTITVPITGGAGHYQNVRGEVHAGGQAEVVFHLLS